SLGSLEELEPWLAGRDYRLDRSFEDSVLMPGLIDNHLHPLLAALLLPMDFVTPDDWNLPDGRVEAVHGQDAYRARLRELEASTPPGRPLYSWGYHQLFHGPLERADLDAISEDRPIVVWHRSFHEIYMNTAALADAGLTAEAIGDHPHVDFDAGHFYETGSRVAMAALAPKIFAPERMGQGLLMLRELAHRGGITTMADMAAGLMTGSVEGDRAIMAGVLESDDTPFRTLLVPEAGGLAQVLGSNEAALANIEALPETGSTRLVHARKQVKLLADGAFFSQLMRMGPPGYIDGHHGEWLMEPAALEAAARVYWNAGYTIHVHANGDQGIDATLDVLQTLLDEKPRFDHRFTLHHYGYSTPEQARRLATLGAAVSANPNYLYVLADKYGEQGLGPDRASQMSRLGSVARAGASVSLHSDLTMAPSQPLFLAWVAANRQSVSGKVHAPGEKLTVLQAIEAVTREAAFAIQMDDEIGTLRAGKRADFTVVDRDPTAIPASELRDVVIEATIFEGRPYPIEPLD
ncbi:MAG: amidohydrolase family protein, partial [Myxococcota bacterium]|nr:amidohydrolase family protein [Myxococcota bacterium]